MHRRKSILGAFNKYLKYIIYKINMEIQFLRGFKDDQSIVIKSLKSHEGSNSISCICNKKRVILYL